MPIKPGKARLWFETEEEIKRYDDMMMANIELTQVDDVSKPNFVFVSHRPHKEYFYEPSEKLKESLSTLESRIEKAKLNSKPASLKYFRELPTLMYSGSFIFIYLAMRELPIRNFHARAVLMSGFLIYFFNRNRFQGNSLMSQFITQKDSETFKTQKQFLPVNRLIQGKSVDTGKSIDEKTRWKLNQTGFYNVHSDGIFQEIYSFKGKQKQVWDGTFSQPVLPLFHRSHRDMAGFNF